MSARSRSSSARRGKDTPARYAEQAAEKAQKVGQRLQDASGDELLRDVEGFARKNPWAVAAGGLVLGLSAASRMLKASSNERYRSSIQNGGGSNGQTRSLAAEPMQSGASRAAGTSLVRSTPSASGNRSSRPNRREQAISLVDTSASGNR